MNKQELKQRQLKFLGYYFNTKNKKTYDNFYQSALAAGYSKHSATKFNSQMAVILKGAIEKQKEKIGEKINIDELVRDLREMKNLFKNPEKVKELKDKGLEFKSSDIVKATELLGKYLKMFSDRIELIGKYTIDDSDEIEVILGNDDEV